MLGVAFQYRVLFSAVTLVSSASHHIQSQLPFPASTTNSSLGFCFQSSVSNTALAAVLIPSVPNVDA